MSYIGFVARCDLRRFGEQLTEAEQLVRQVLDEENLGTTAGAAKLFAELDALLQRAVTRYVEINAEARAYRERCKRIARKKRRAAK